MNDWKYFFDCELKNPEQFNYRIFASDSKAEILYWFSRNDIPKQQKEDLIRALVNFDDNCGGFYRYRAYLLAAEALNYFPESSYCDQIVKQLLDWSYLYFGWKLFPQPLVEAARKALEVTDKTRVVRAFEWLLRNTPSRLTLQSAATKLGELDSGNKMAIAALILLLDVTKENYKRSSIFRSLGRIGFGNQAAVNTVIDETPLVYIVISFNSVICVLMFGWLIKFSSTKIVCYSAKCRDAIYRVSTGVTG